jgi:hypothetical protein
MWARLAALIALVGPLAAPRAHAQDCVGPEDDLEGAINQLQPGDELVVCGGDYTLDERFSFDLSGTEQAPIVIRAAAIRPHFRRTGSARPAHGLILSTRPRTRHHTRSPADANPGEVRMLLIRDIMHCKPGKVRPMFQKFLAMKAVGERTGWGTMRVMTDLCAERYWTLVSEMEVESLEAFMSMGQDPEDEEEFGEIMKDYHDLVIDGRREIYTIEE